MNRFITLFLSVFFASSVIASAGNHEKAIELTGGFEHGGCQKYTFGADFVYGYNFTNLLYLGAGAGYKYIDGVFMGSNVGSEGTRRSFFDSSNIPIYGRVRLSLINSVVSPYIAANIGYNVGLSSLSSPMANGLLVEPMFGCAFNISQIQKIYISIGYHLQHYEYQYIYLGGDEMREYMDGTFNLRLGFSF